MAAHVGWATFKVLHNTLYVRTDKHRCLSQQYEYVRHRQHSFLLFFFPNRAQNCGRNDREHALYRALVGKPDAKRPLGRPRRRWEVNTKIDLQKVGWGQGLIDLARDIRNVPNMAMWGSTCNHNYLYRWLPCQYFILLMMGAWRPKHVEKVCSNKICILFHHDGVFI